MNAKLAKIDVFADLLDNIDFPVYKRYEMNALEIANLTEILKLQYPNVCLSYDDYRQITTVPANKKCFYPCSSRAAKISSKHGFILHEKGQTAIWTDWKVENGTIKIAFGAPTASDKGWSESFSFKEEGSPMTIYKMMKLKAFW